MGEVVDDEDVGSGEEDGGDVADDDLAVQVAQLGDGAVDDEGDEEEEAGDGSADRVDQPQDAANIKVNQTVDYQSFIKLQILFNEESAIAKEICNIKEFLLKRQPLQPSRAESNPI